MSLEQILLKYDVLVYIIGTGVIAVLGAGGGTWMIHYVIESYNIRRDNAAKEVAEKAVQEYAAVNSETLFRIQKENAELEKEFRGFSLESSVRFERTEREIIGLGRQIQDTVEEIRLLEERMENRLNKMDEKIDKILAFIIKKSAE